MTTKIGSELKVGDILKTAQGDATIKNVTRKSKHFHGAMIYETTDRRAIAVHPTAEVEVA